VKLTPNTKGIFAALLGGGALAAIVLKLLATGGTNIYVSQSGAGAQTGVDAADAYPLSWLTTSGNWGSSAGQVGPGVTVHLVGAITADGFAILGSGMPSNVITILFEPGAYMSSPAQATTGYGIFINSKSNIVVDGGGTNNGAIFCTANGYGKTYTNNVGGVYVINGDHITVQNLAITNLYTTVSGIHDPGGGGSGVVFQGAFTNCAALNCLFHDEWGGCQFNGSGPLSLNCIMSNCVAYNVNWGGSAAVAASGEVINGVLVTGNHFYDWSCWDDLDDANHHNGFYCYGNSSGGWVTNVVETGNLVGPGYGNNQTSGFFFQYQVFAVQIQNNVFDGRDNTGPKDGFITLQQLDYASSIQITNTVVNNTFDTFGNVSDGILFGANNPGPSVILTSRNNLFISNYLAIYLNYYTGTVNIGTFDYDLIYGCGSTPVGWSTTSSGGAVSLATWQASGLETHAVTGNPVLNAVFVPQTGSAAIGAGVIVDGNVTGFNALPLFNSIGANGPSGTNTGGVTILGNASGVMLVGAGPGTNGISLIGTP
jgi:hypothetical protein